MRSLSLILLAIIAPFAQADSLFRDFMLEPEIKTGLAEIKKADVIAAMESVKLTEIPRADGTGIKKDHVMMASPYGIKVMGDAGIHFVPWFEIRQDFRDACGWSEEVFKRYDARKKVEEREITAHIRRDQSEHAKSVSTGSYYSARKFHFKEPSADPAVIAERKKQKEDVMKQIRMRAELEWPGDFRMQEDYIGRQSRAYSELLDLIIYGIRGIPKHDSALIINAAIDENFSDFTAVVREIKDQAAAWKRIHQ